MKPFFDTDQTKEILKPFSAMLRGISGKGEFEQSRNQMIITVLDFMLSAPTEWDRNCQITINWIGSQFRSSLDTERLKIEGTEQGLDEVFSSCFRFLLELYLSKQGNLVRELDRVREFGIENIDRFSGHAKDQMQYAVSQMPLSLFKKIANTDEISSLSEFNKLIGQAKQLKNDWDQELVDKKLEVDNLKNDLAKYQTGFNFVGLYQGFDELAGEKSKERSNLLFWLRAISAFIFFTVVTEFILLGVFWAELWRIEVKPLIILFPAISITAISLYFFRVLLLNYKSVKSQLLQIDLRKTLCRFIQAYAVCAKDMKDKDKDSLERFESIIFSGIVSDEGSLSANYDGVEQIGKLIKSVKG